MQRNKYAHPERECRYLVCNLPTEIMSRTDFRRIIDLYITGTRLRLRRIEDSNGLVIDRKFGQKYLKDGEFDSTLMTNFYIDEAEYQALSVLEGSKLVKRRYPYIFEQQKFSIDVFEGELSGLLLCEKELEEGENPPFNLPSFVTREVTHEVFFTGGSLANTTAHELAERMRDECRS
jgi:CYTH domain-containing protein